MSTHLTPLQVCERLIGRLEDIGRAAGVDEKQPYKWRRASAHRAAGDIPLLPARRLLRWCAEAGIPLSAEHIVYGATEPEIARLRLVMGNTRMNGTASLPQVAAQ